MAAHRFMPGHSGNPGGRPKRLLKRADEIMHERGFSPLEALLAMLPELEGRDKAKVLLELMAYVYAKPRDMGETTDPLEGMSEDQLAAMIASDPQVTAMVVKRLKAAS